MNQLGEITQNPSPNCQYLADHSHCLAEELIEDTKCIDKQLYLSNT